ncbi:MtrAB system histidine kinase MtrB [Naasia sp. SYSU D00057]|uniref:MtrAB system histidine kinase MtrB n=1 Tax=Naasia sp. SYSU D00057 TaxID=2817380 RepID=UPI0027DCF9DA|nr:MtrAB system histidine kinase MtrB [Naasia sp. SYSU D00057]
MTSPRPAAADLRQIPFGIRLAGLTRAPRTAYEAVVRAFRRSLEVRIVAITLLLSAFAMLGTGTYMTYTIGNGLFDARVEQVTEQSARATELAQSTFDTTTAADDSALGLVQLSVIDRIGSIATSYSGIAFLRATDTETNFALPDVVRGNADTYVSDELRQRVSSGQEDQYWQSVSINGDSGDGRPGVVVGSAVDVPGAGAYELYLLYDLSEVQQTLTFVQGTMAFGGMALILLIGAVTWIVVQLVIAPVRIAAETSSKLAAGHLEERIPERGEDVIATLAHSFNEMADSLQHQITELAGLSRVQQRFVSDVSHELRTPLTTIRLAGDVLYDQREKFEPTTARTAELLHTQVERFESLLTDLLEISRYDARAVEIEREPVNLVKLAEDAMGGMESLAERKGTELRLVAPGGHFEAELDARRIRRIVRNLLANAIEHGEGKPIEVIVDSNETAVALAVRDHGVGMSTADASRVFDRFWRADPSRKRTTGGTGLGLAISLEDAALHGGTIDVWSAPGQGSSFRLTLPRRPGVPIASSPLPLPPEDAA